MQGIVLSNSGIVTMTSREIADLVGKRHDHVIRDIRAMLAELGDAPDLGDGSDLSHVKESKDSRGYTTEFSLPKDLTLTLVTGYDIKRRHAINVRWLELESRASDPMQVLNDPAAMRGLLLGYTEKVIELEAKVEKIQPMADALVRIAGTDGMLHLQAAGKVLQQPPNKFIQWLREIGWIYKRAGNSINYPRSAKADAGYLTVKAVTVTKPDGSDFTKEQTYVTPKGLAKLSVMLGVQQDVLGGM